MASAQCSCDFEVVNQKKIKGRKVVPYDSRSDLPQVVSKYSTYIHQYYTKQYVLQARGCCFFELTLELNVQYERKYTN